MEVPAQNLTDFMRGSRSSRLNSGPQKMGAIAADMNDILPEFISERLHDRISRVEGGLPVVCFQPRNTVRRGDKNLLSRENQTEGSPMNR